MANTKELALVLEITKGCTMSCAGCNVDKGADTPADNDLIELLNLVYEVSSHGVVLAELELGATDILTATNRSEIFSNSYIKLLAEHFSVVVVNCGLVNPNKELYDELADNLNGLSSNPTGVTTPVEIRHVFNDKYISRIEENLQHLKSKLKHGLTEVILNVIYDDTLVNDEAHYLHLFKRLRDISFKDINVSVDFAFHQGRKLRESDFFKQSLLNSIKQLNKHYLLDMSERKEAERRHIPSMLLFKEEIKELVYSAGKLSVRPILNERIYVDHDDFILENDWNANTVFAKFDAMTIDNFWLSENNKECCCCPHRLSCATRNVNKLMSVLGTDECLSIAKSFSVQ